jgi:hypothetical protein
VSAAVLKTAVPLAFKAADPNVLVPLTKVTVPVGTVVPDFGATVAVKVTLCPVLTWVGEAVSDVVVGTLLEVIFTVTAVEVDPASFVSPP